MAFTRSGFDPPYLHQTEAVAPASLVEEIAHAIDQYERVEQSVTVRPRVAGPWYALAMSLYVEILEMKKLLRGVDGWLDKAVAYAATRKFDANVLLQTRLSPDMFPLVRQIQAVCDQAKYAAGRTSGKELPSHPDTEQTIDELKKRIASVVAYLESFSEKDFAEVATRTVTTPRWEGKHMTATNYFVEHAQPNFFFHLSMAYALLRHNGVDVGKRDYLGTITYI